MMRARELAALIAVAGAAGCGGDGGCAPPLQIEVSSICDRNALVLDVDPSHSAQSAG